MPNQGEKFPGPRRRKKISTRIGVMHSSLTCSRSVLAVEESPGDRSRRKLQWGREKDSRRLTDKKYLIVIQNARQKGAETPAKVVNRGFEYQAIKRKTHLSTPDPRHDAL